MTSRYVFIMALHFVRVQLVKDSRPDYQLLFASRVRWKSSLKVQLIPGYSNCKRFCGLIYRDKISLP